jgi:uncharacterized Zn-binding protein involved in type VI secretion
MALTVFAENMGLFHKGSGGKGIAPADVCLSPPPPPTGPAPIPYVNSLMASDLANGSATVTIDGEPTALEDASEIATSTGDEPGTQGGNVLTHKTKGKGFFKLWSFTVKIEGKGVCRHGDLVGQNCASDPPGCIDAAALTSFLSKPWVKPGTPCPPYPYTKPTDEQDDHVRNGPCWNCPTGIASGRGARPARGPWAAYKPGERFTSDHQPPQKIAWFVGGCHDPEAFKEWVTSKEAVLPHCSKCSPRQGGLVSGVPVSPGGTISVSTVQALIW